MLELYFGGNKVGSLSGADKLIEYAARHEPLEVRDATGRVVGRFIPDEPICPWEPSLTVEDLDRESAQGGGITLAEFWAKMGAQ
jgi:hypothetical protein